MARKAIVSAIAVAALLHAGGAGAQVPVIDSATLTQATQTAANTAQIMQTNQQILNYTQQNAGGGDRQPLDGDSFVDRLERRLLHVQRTGTFAASRRRRNFDGGARSIRLDRLVDHQRPQSREDADGREFGVDARPIRPIRARSIPPPR